MKVQNITSIVFIIGLLLFSCNQKNENNPKKEIEEFMIKTEYQKSQKDSLGIYYIKEPSDSMYTGNIEDKYPNGVVKYKGFYRFGKRHGEWLYFYPNGNLWSECKYNRGKMNGKTNTYHPNGKLFYSGFYKDDKKDSIWIYYDSTGKQLYKELYKENKLIKRIQE